MINIENNAMLEIIKSREIQFFYPVISDSGDVIYTFLKKGQKYAIAQITMDGNYSLLTQWDDIVFGPLKLSDGYLIFHASYDGIDNLFAIDLGSKQLKRISDDPIGLYNPSNFADGRIISARPSSKGFMLNELKTSPKAWQNHAVMRLENTPYYIETKHLEPNDILAKLPDNKFETEPYPGTAKLINPHSWFFQADGDEFSASIISTNVLNNLEITPTYRYNNNVGASFVDLSISYGYWFPYYTTQYTYSFPRVIKSQDGERSFDVSQHSIRPSIIIPLTLTRGLYSSSLTFNNSISLNFLQVQEIQSQERFDQEATTINNTITYQRTKLRPVQNYYPKWGINSIMRNRYRTNDSHNIFNISNDFYVPGFHPNHGFKFEVDFAMQNVTADDRFPLIDLFDYAEGFRSIDYDNIIGFNTNYGLPVAYPDLGFWDFMYFKRINAVLFHNYNRINFDGQNTDLQSFGADVLFDLVFINNVFSEISVGFRNAYLLGPLPEGKSIPYHFEFIVDIPAF